MTEEHTQKEIESPLADIVDIAINDKDIDLNLYPAEDINPLELITTKASIGQFHRYEERLREWQTDPIQKGGEGVEGFVIEIITAQTLANIFKDNNDITVKLSPKQLDFIDSKHFDYDNPSFDLMICKKYKDGVIPLALIGTTASKKRGPRIHKGLQAVLFNLTAKEDLNLILPGQNVFEIGMDQSGEKFRNLTIEKKDTLKDNLTKKLEEERDNIADTVLINKLNTLLKILNSDNSHDGEEVPSWSKKVDEETKQSLKDNFLKLDPNTLKDQDIKDQIFFLTKKFYKVIEALGISAYIPGEDFLLFQKVANKGSKDETNYALKVPILIDDMGIENINADNTGLIINRPLSEESTIVTSALETGDIERYLNAMKEIIND